MDRHGHAFSVVADQERPSLLLSGAWPGQAHLLPYQHEDLSRRYLMAVVDLDQEDVDPPSDNTLGEYGVSFGPAADPSFVARRRKIFGRHEEKIFVLMPAKGCGKQSLGGTAMSTLFLLEGAGLDGVEEPSKILTRLWPSSP